MKENRIITIDSRPTIYISRVTAKNMPRSSRYSARGVYTQPKVKIVYKAPIVPPPIYF